MREIKFRGLAINNKWLIGYLIKQGAYYFIQNTQGGNDVILQNTIGQFTGLTDKNGVQIYEGDIVSWGKEYSDEKIIFLNGCFGYESDYGFVTLAENNFEFMEVVGNIHELV